MQQQSVRRLLVAATAALVPLLSMPHRAGAEAGTAGACPGDAGVTVVVDAQELSSAGPGLRCAPEAGGNGLEILTRAGVRYQTASRSPGFVCKVADLPSDEPCTNTSPASAYWSYWLAVRGGSWCLSNRGAQGRTPPAGTVEGWSFAKDRQDTGPVPPRAAPPARRAGERQAALPAGDCDTTSQTGPTTTTTRSAAGPSASTTPPRAPAAAPVRTPGDGAAPTTSPADPATTAPVAPTTTAGASPAVTAPGPLDPQDPGSDPGPTTPEAATGPPVTLDLVGRGGDGGGPGPGPAVAGGAAVLALGAGALVLRRRRAAG